MRTPYLKVAAFFAFTGLASAFMVYVLSDFRGGGDPTPYRAVFSDASFLKKGDPVRIAGVDVGDVDGLRYRPDGSIGIEFHVNGDRPLPLGARASIRYKNLVGDRVLVLEQGPKPKGRLAANATIPLARTSPALDLDELTGGFRPLLQALNPDQVNALSTNLVAVVQGQGGAVASLLDNIAALTGTLADRRVVIDRLITNLSATISTVDDRSAELDRIVTQLQSLVGELDANKDPVLTAAADIADFGEQVAKLLGVNRPDLASAVRSIGKVADTLRVHSDDVGAFLRNLGPAYDAIAGIGVYGDFFNFFLCDVRVKVSGPTGTPIYTPWVDSNVARCNGRATGS